MIVMCMPGQHVGPECSPPEVPSNWRLVRADFNEEGELVYDPNSNYCMPACPFHFVKGEPELN